MRFLWPWRLLAALAVVTAGLEFSLVSHPNSYWQGFMDGSTLVMIGVLLWLVLVLRKPRVK